MASPIKTWLCEWGNGECDGRVLFAFNEYPELVAVDQTAECPVCSFPKTYHGCRWVMIADA